MHALEGATKVGENMIDTEDIAEKAMEFVKAMQTAKATEASVRVMFDAGECRYIRQL